MSIALVAGCAENVWEDSRHALALFEPDAIVAVKDITFAWPGRIDYAVTLHPDRMEGYLKKRLTLKRNCDFEIWAHKMYRDKIHKTTSDWQGGSGLFGVKVALEEGFTGIVLVGIPLDPRLKHIIRQKEWLSASFFRAGWKRRLPNIQDSVRSMSGWTRELLGEPTVEWLASKGASKPNGRGLALFEEMTTGT